MDNKSRKQDHPEAESKNHERRRDFSFSHPFSFDDARSLGFVLGTFLPFFFMQQRKTRIKISPCSEMGSLLIKICLNYYSKDVPPSPSLDRTLLVSFVVSFFLHAPCQPVAVIGFCVLSLSVGWSLAEFFTVAVAAAARY